MSAAAASSAAMANGDNVVLGVSSSQGSLSGAPVTDPSSTFLALKIAPRSKKDRKTNPIWNFFVAVHPSVTEYKPNSYVCLICRERKINSVVCLGRIHNISPSGLSSYMRSNHREEYDEFLKSIAVKKKNPMRPVTPLITHHFTPKVDPKLVFKKRYAQWIVETSQPFTVSLTDSFRAMINCLNPNVTFPDRKELMSIFDGKKIDTMNTIKEMIGSNFFSVTTDHWTSISNENYGVITLHFIYDFKLTTVVMSFQKHKGGCTGEELQEQMFESINSWQLPLQKFVACVTDSASNMNKMGEYIIKKKVAHHYCADHIIQLTAEKAFSSGSVVCSLQKLKNLVNHVNKSPKINDRLRTCQVKCGFKVKLKLISDVKTRWWSTYDMISRALKVRIDY